VVVVNVIGVVLVGLGILLGVPAAGLAVLIGLEEIYTAYALRHPGRFRRTAVSGRTAGGQVAPVSGTPCAWWRLSITQWREDAEGGEWVEVWSSASGDTVQMTRPGTPRLSAVLVGYELRRESGVKTVVRKGWEGGVGKLVSLGLVPGDRFKDGQAVETFVPEGVPIVAVGRMRGGVLSRSVGGTGVNGVSTLALDEVRGRAWKQMKETWLMVRGLGLASLVCLGIGYGLVELAAAFTPK
jgi:hypothetical protein